MMLYPDAWQDFADRSGRMRTEKTKDTFRALLRTLQYEHPKVPLERFTTQQLTDYCMKRTPSGGTPAPATIRTRRSVIKSFFDWCEFDGKIKTNPATKLHFTVSPGTGNAKPGLWLTEVEVGRVVRACPDTGMGRRDRLILMIGFFTGLRRGSIAELTAESFNSTLTEVQFLGKGNKHSTSAVPEQLRAVLRSWMDEIPEGGVLLPRFGQRFVNSWYEQAMVPSWNLSLTEAGIERVVAVAGARVGLPSLRPHDMRRTFAGILEAQGVKLPDISRAMHHANIGTTSRYLESNPARTVGVTSGFTINF